MYLELDQESSKCFLHVSIIGLAIKNGTGRKSKKNEENSQEEVIEAKMSHRLWLKQILSDINFDKIYDFFTFYAKIMYIFDEWILG